MLQVTAPLLKLGDLSFEELFQVDIGEQINADCFGRQYFAPGELMQFVCVVAGLKIWICRNARMEWFKVAFGENPAPFHECKTMARDEAECFIKAKVMILEKGG
jgi:hypothetical protein